MADEYRKLTMAELDELAGEALPERAAMSLDLDRLGELAAEVIGEDEAARTVRRLRRLR